MNKKSMLVSHSSRRFLDSRFPLELSYVLSSSSSIMLTIRIRKLVRHVALRRNSSSTARFSSQTPPKPTNFTVQCNSRITKHGRDGDIGQAESLFRRMPRKTTVSYTAMLTAYAQNGRLADARKVFDEMPDRTTASYNAMISAYTGRKRMVDEAFRLFCQMGSRNAVSYGAMITGFVRAGMFDKAKALYGEMPVGWQDPVCSNALMSGYLKVGRLEDAVRVFDGMVERDVVSWSCIVDGYCKQGRVEEARNVFDKMVEKNVVTWTSIIDGYMSTDQFSDGLRLFLKMRREGNVEANPNTLTTMLDACGNAGRCREGIQIHALVFHLGYQSDVFLCNSMITMYSRIGRMDEANAAFQEIAKRDVVSWNSLINGYIENNQVEKANEIFERMPVKDRVSWTIMIAGFSGKGDVEKSMQMFNMTPEKDDFTWTALISGFVNCAKYEEAVRWFTQMLKNEVRPNTVTLSCVLGASACLATLNQGLQLHAFAVKMNMEGSLSIQNALVSMYSKCGDLAEAYSIFTTISSPNVVSFNSMITGFSQNGMGEAAIELFRKMSNNGCKPNEITFIGVLSACSHIGLVEEGQKYFNSMRTVYDIEPGQDHYTCMVDLLGRAGLLDEAVNFIDTMPLEPHSGVWGALLGASRTHIRLDLAKLAASHLTKLEPKSATPYVILCDLYSMAGKKEDEEQLRMTKTDAGLRKSPGSSWVTVKDQVHVFLAGDRTHADLEHIQVTLRTLAKQMSWFDLHNCCHLNISK